MANLNNYLAVCFDRDSIVYPRESACWCEMNPPATPGEERTLTQMEDTDLYKQDYIGLKKLNEKGQLHIAHINGDHEKFTDEDIRNLMVPLLKS